MAYIGKIPTAAALTSSDISDGIITNAKLAQDIISADTALGAEPADTDEFLVSDAGTLKRMDYSHIKASGGLAEFDQWRITANTTSNADITSNLERNDSTGFGLLGTGMSESSGIFTFPSTGYWLIEIYQASKSGGGGGDDVELQLKVTTDNSSYTEVTKTENDMGDQEASNLSTSFLFDVTSTTNCKCKFTTEGMSDGNSFIIGSSSFNLTHFNFSKVGDT